MSNNEYSLALYEKYFRKYKIWKILDESFVIKIPSLFISCVEYCYHILEGSEFIDYRHVDNYCIRNKEGIPILMMYSNSSKLYGNMNIIKYNNITAEFRIALSLILKDLYNIDINPNLIFIF